MPHQVPGRPVLLILFFVSFDWRRLDRQPTDTRDLFVLVHSARSRTVVFFFLQPVEALENGNDGSSSLGRGSCGLSGCEHDGRRRRWKWKWNRIISVGNGVGRWKQWQPRRRSSRRILILFVVVVFQRSADVLVLFAISDHSWRRLVLLCVVVGRRRW